MFLNLIYGSEKRDLTLSRHAAWPRAALLLLGVVGWKCVAAGKPTAAHRYIDCGRVLRLRGGMRYVSLVCTHVRVREIA
jgi:hypothetical protein